MKNYMKLMRAYIKEAESSIAFEKRVKALRTQAILAKKMLLATKYFDLSDESKHVSAFLFLFFYRTLFLFPDKEIYDKFESLGVKKGHLQWFIPIEELEDLFTKTRNQDVFIYRDSAFEMMSVYINLQMFFDISIWAGLYTLDKKGNKKPEYIKQLETVERKRKDQRTRRNKVKDPYKIFLFDFANKLNLAGEKRGFKEGAVVKLIKGQHEKHFLTQFLKNSFFYRNSNKKEDYFLNSIYDLCKLFLKNANMPTQADVERRGIYIGKSEQGWRAHVLRNIIYGQGRENS